MNENENLSCAQPHHYDNWQTIPWGKIIFKVSRLQNRIAKAVKTTAGFLFAEGALKVLEPYAGNLALPVPHGGIRFLGGVSYPVAQLKLDK